MSKKPNKKSKEKLPETIISFTKQRKTAHDKLVDLVKKNTKVELKVRTVKKKIKSGKNKGKYRRVKETYYQKTGVTALAREIGITSTQLNRFYTKGVPDKYKDKIQAVWEEGDFKATINRSIEYEGDTLTKENFFTPKKIRRLYKHERYYFRCGLYLVFRSNTNGGDYIIPNLPVPVGEENIQAKNYLSGFWQMYDEIKKVLQKHKSLKFWRINYFDVHIVDITKPTLQFKKGKNNKTIYGKK